MSVSIDRDLEDYKTGSGKSNRALVLLFIILAALFASIGMAEAAGTPTKLLTFTDKKTYTGWNYALAKNGAPGAGDGDLTGDLKIIVYAVVLDDDGIIMTGRSGSLSGSANEIEKLNPGGAAGHHSITTNPGVFGNIGLTFVDDGSIPEDTASDGIYVAVADLNDASGPALLSAHIKYNISVTDSGVGTKYTDVLITGVACMQSNKPTMGSSASHVADTGAANSRGTDNCAVCHPGYEHWYENISSTFRDDQLDAHFDKLTGIDVSAAGAQKQIFNNYRWNYSDSQSGGSIADNWEAQVPGSKYCAECHIKFTDGTYSEIAIDGIADYWNEGTGTLDSSKRPLCSDASCHISGTTSMEGTAIPSWNPAAMGSDPLGSYNNYIADAKAHNHSTTTPANVTCVLCHGTTHSLALPNFSSTSGLVIDQCKFCHTSDGPSTSPHGASTTNCKSCHKDGSGKLDAHLVPIAVSGGRDCGRCHDISGAEPVNIDVDVTNMGTGAHANLNSGASSTGGNATYEKCWACHGLTGGDTTADETDQPAGEHPSTYKTPRGCPDCHNNTDANTNFSAPQVVEHIDAAPTVPTTGTKCSICHNNSLTTINEIDGFGISDSKNASVSHYLTTASLMTAQNKSNDCIWCHITNNQSAIADDWGTPFDPRNGTNYQHTEDNVASNDNCYSCHGGLTASVKLHDSGITAGGSGGQDCVNCHDGTTGSKVNVDSMNNSDSIHLNLNTGGTANGRAENKMCYACHTNDSYISGGVVNNNSIPASSHPTGYKTPKNCTQCHINTDSNTNFSAPQVQEHYMSGTELQTRNYANLNYSCIVCHVENEMLQPYSDDTDKNYSNVSHYGKSRNNTALVAGDVVNCKYCHDNGSSTTFDFVDTTNRTISNHSANYPLTTPECTLCHNEGRMHDGNLTVPELDETLCTGCHTTRDNHNNSVSCISCHVNSSASRDKVHPINYITVSGTFDSVNTTAVNCTDCHQTGVTGFESAPLVPDPLRHSTNLSNGSIWGSFWNDEEGSCQYCHGDSRHNLTALGTPSNFQGSNVVGGVLTGTTWCLGCHLNGSANYNNMLTNLSPVPPEITAGDTNYPVSGSPKDHTGLTMVTDNDCTVCHAGDTTNITTYMHYLEVGQGGGRNCTSCHDIGRSMEKVDVSKMNTSTSIHNNLNSFATATNADNKRCWACHSNSTVSGDGQVDESELPDDDHPDGYDTPKNCTLCHIDNNFGALIVGEHFTGGTEIKTKQYGNTNDSCVNCHNKTEMLLSNNDPAGPKSIYASVSHYGDNKTGVSPYNTGSTSNCTYCHNNSGTVFGTEMVDSASNTSITNHTNLGTNPGCTNSTCHNTGRIHFSALTRPTVSTSLCTTCHDTKSRHNDSIECSSCHLETNLSIHGIQYLQPDTSWGINSPANKSSAVNCTDCHQSGVTGFETAPIVNQPVNHSSNNSGQKWATYWLTDSDSCQYCHGDSRHNTSALGKPGTFQGSNTIGSDLTGTWCLGCHLNGSANYNNMLANMSLIPPSITNNSNDPNYPGGSAVNHSSYTLTTDNDCTTCHGGSTTNISTYMHELEPATSCTVCHAQPPSGVSRYNTTGAHNTHNNSTFQSLYGVLGEDTGCNYCHDTAGSGETGHPQNDGNADVITNGSANITTYTQNTAAGNDDTCSGVDCHNRNLPPNAVAGTGTWSTTTGTCNVCHSTNATTGVPASDAHTIHNVTKGYTCALCHSGYPSNHFSGGNADISYSGLANSSGSFPSTWTQGSQTCYVYCHDPNGAANAGGDSFAVWTNSTDRTCDSCHDAPPTKTRTGSAHPANSVCQDCHEGYTISTVNTQTHINGNVESTFGGKNCTSCHDGSKVDVGSMNQSNNIHSSLNNVGGQADRVEDKFCWACHTNSSLASDGSVTYDELPDGTHPDSYATPRNCTLCHINTGTSNFSAPQVQEHYSGGLELTTRSYVNVNDSCTGCHTAAEMLDSYTDNTGNNYSNVSHYGISRNNTNLVTGNVVDCTYCHQNASTLFDFVDSTNSTLSNHSSYATSPSCSNSTCHNSGRMHAASLTIPSPDNTLCTSCHTTRQNHSGTVSCLSCHVNSSASRDKIHPVKYITPSAGFSTSNTTAVNCTDCHQSGVTGFGTAPIVNQPVNHSSNNSGQKWATYWLTDSDSCQYCHGDSRHNTSALGKPGTFQGSNTIGSDLTGTWCLGCHLNGSANYNNMLANMSLIPPSITNNSNDPNYPGGSAVNHSSYTLTNDSTCTTCHGGSTTNVSTYMHDLEPATSCTVCHSQPPSGVSRYNTTGAHNTHNSSTFQSLYGALGEDTGCNYCHNTSGSGETGHPQNDGNADVITNGSANITTYIQNTTAGNDDTCSGVDCHNRNLPANATAGTGTWSTTTGTCNVCHSTNATTGVPASDAHTIHNVTKGYTCALCHSGYPANHFNGGNADISYSGLANSSGSFPSTWTQGSQTCYVYCHDPNGGANAGGDSFAIWTNSTDRTCDSCHDAPPTKTRTGSEHPANSVCQDCHDGYTISTVNTQTHINGNVESTFGGQNCTSCHDIGQSTEKVDVSKMNTSTSIHTNLNSLATATNADNKRCWACHSNSTVSGDGQVDESELPDSEHPDGYDTPKNCTLCHIDNKFGALIVGEHFTGGTDIKTKQYGNTNDSCVNCHNKTEMLLSNSDPAGPKSIYASVSHYGDNKTGVSPYNTGSTSNCTYCHNNSGTAFGTEMVDSGSNTSITNHTNLGTNPGCTNSTCHNTGRIHFSALTRPTVSTSLCTTCHDTKSRHNDSIECSSCHLETNLSIHGIQYLQPDTSWGLNSPANKSSAVNCTDCHQDGISGFSSAPIIPDPLQHSSNLTNGSIWGSYWSDEEGSCHYCHEDTRHNATAFGKVNSLLSDNNNTRGGTLSTTTWCADCHYNGSANLNYLGNQWSPAPPVITVDTGLTGWENHTTYLGSGYKDTICKDCHGSAVSGYTEDSLNFSHAVSEGGGGPDCVSSGCHGSTGSATSPYMNWTSLKTGMHSNLNSGADTTGMTDPIVAACWACHGDGTKPGGHPTTYKQPYYCKECHLASGNITGQYPAIIVSEHQHVDAQVLTSSATAKCENCHYNSLVDYSDNETNTLTDYVVGNVSHYGANSTAGKLMDSSVNSTNCVYCHLNDSNRAKWANAINSSETKPTIHSGFNATTDSSECWSCHVDGGASTVTAGFTLHNDSLNPGASEFCLNCHTPGGSAQNVNVSSNDLGLHVNLNTSAGTGILNNSDCWSCHFGYPNGTAGSHSYNVNRQNTYYCEDCHGPVKNSTAQSRGYASSGHALADFYHGKSYFDSAPKYKDCTVCHAPNYSRYDTNGNRLKTYHNQTPLGKVGNTGWDGWTVGMIPSCNDCHQTRNLNDGPFYAPGKDHYVSSSGRCSVNCHEGDINRNVHKQYLFGDTTKVYGINPPRIDSVAINSPVVIGEYVNITVTGWDNGLQIEAGQYRVLNSSGGEVFGWTNMIPQNNKFKSRIEIARGSIDTNDLSPGNYTVYLRVMSSGPRSDQTKRAYPLNGAWSSISMTGFTVKQ